MKLTKQQQQVIEIAKTSSEITMTDPDLGYDHYPISFDRMMSEIEQFGRGRWIIERQEKYVYIDLKSRIHFAIACQGSHE